MKIDTEQVIATYKDRIFAIGLTMLKNPDDAEDVVQETFGKENKYLWKIIWQRFHLIDHRMKNYFKQ